jgi:dolichol-phosphate mannosyltransferase
MAFRSFYGLFRLLTDVDLPVGCGLFSLMDRRVVMELRRLRERHRFVPGLRRWLGFRQCSIDFERGKRYAGEPRQSLTRLVQLALDAILSFSARPLTLALWFGLLVSLFCMIGCLIIVYMKLFTDAAIPGWASNMVTTLFIGGVQLIVLGIVGQYVARIYDEIKARPTYVIKSVTGGPKESERDQARADRDTQTP